MDSMIENMARAIAGHFGPEFDALPKDKAERINRNRMGEMFDDSQEDVLDAAKAALQALMEPTPGMVEAGWAAERPWVHPKESLAGAYKAMIRTALDEGEG